MDKNKIMGEALKKYVAKHIDSKEVVNAIQFIDVAMCVLEAVEESLEE
ncbi:hypothetical protein JHL18_00605 [Clostridium sp. YIM B02505]|uniref:Uncharacterized protein n=1 Tax=Clostridium yunnanense TaxID=2800325 RepID=A0ABS1EIH1_9CLOT|nr:hypothetical protein [Clostridium yunnanense]MBK1809148.1 hypothetical protein [Clostridium yunnanense]